MDDYTPTEISRRVEDASVAKAQLSLQQTVLLAVLGGAFIALGALFFLQVLAGTTPVTGVDRWLGGLAFSLGLIMIVVGGAELFTGNMLLVMAAVDGRISVRELLTNWSLVLAGNALGAVGIVLLCGFAGLFAGQSSALVPVLQQVIESKASLSFAQCFARGVMCNVFVCMAVWLAMSCRLTISKIVAIALPISAFVALGLEHNIANLFFFPAYMLATSSFDASWVATNLIPVTIGNMIGGGILVGLIYRTIYPQPKN